MNKTKIEWTDYTWNPVTGCMRNCWYCYVKRIRNYDQTPTFHPDRIGQPLKVTKPSMIFVCSTADLFAEWAQNRWMRYIMRTIEKCQRHTFQFLTKSPEGYLGWEFPENCWLGVTITGDSEAGKLQSFGVMQVPNLKFVSFEPMLEPFREPLPESIKWIIIGAMTGSDCEKYRPDPAWVSSLVIKARETGAAVFLKNNLMGIWPGELIQEFPK